MTPVIYLSVFLQQENAGTGRLFNAVGQPADAKAKLAHREVP